MPDSGSGGVPLVSIVVVVYNALNHVKQCIEDIKAFTHIPYELIMVDNASQEDTVSYLKSVDGIRLVLNDTNKLWCAGCNDGMKVSHPKSKYIVLLNSDVRILRHDWLEVMIALLEGAPRVAVVGPKHCHVKTGPMYGWIDGHCLMMRREQIAAHGWFDEKTYPWNGAPADFAAAMFKKGWRYKVLHPDERIVYHHEHASTDPKVTKNAVAKVRKPKQVIYDEVLARYGITAKTPLLERVKLLHSVMVSRRFYQAPVVPTPVKLPSSVTADQS